MVFSVNILVETYKPSYIDRLSKEEFINIIQQCFSRREFFIKLNMRLSGSSCKILNRRIKEDNVDISHFKSPSLLRKTKGEIPLSELLVKNSRYISSSSLKSKLIKHKLLKYQCCICNNDGNHFGKPLVLQLDHINGERNDNRIENLRILCPNCHTQTETFCGKHKKIKEKIQTYCAKCGKTKKQKYSEVCYTCNKSKPCKKKIKWPEDSILISMLQNSPMTKVGKILGVSDSAIKKHCIKNNIDYKSRIE